MAGQTSTDPNIFILPDLGEGVHEAELIAWKVSPGDSVEEHDIVAEMETDKALVEVPSPRAGVIKQLFGKPGDILKVGEPAWTYEGAPDAAPVAAQTASADHTKPASTGIAKAAKSIVDNGPSAKGAGESGADDDAGTVVGTMTGQLGAVTGKQGSALATPAVRRLARDLGIDIDRLSGTGIAGRVTEKDVRAAAGDGRSAGAARPHRQQREAPQQPQRAEPAAPAAPAANRLATTVRQQEVVSRPASVLVPSGDEVRIPIRGVRRKIAQRLRESVDRAVHFSVFDDADVSNLDDARARLAAASGEKLSYLPFVVMAVCRALKEFPALNATVDDENEEIIRHNVVHMGIAADTDQGLSVPVIFNADAMGVLEVGRHITDLARQVRDRSIDRDRLMGSTFTISNVGSYAGRYATPIINYPEVGILAVGRVRDGVVADRGAIRVAKLLPLSLTCDHRSVDGAEAARCLAHIIELLQHPEELLTPARR